MHRLAAILLVAFPVAARSLFEYDRTVPFEWQSEPLSPRKDVILSGASFQTRKGRRMDAILVEPAGKGAGKRPAILFQHGGGQSMATYVGDAILLAKAGEVSLILRRPTASPPRSRSKALPKAPVNAIAWWILSWLYGGRSTGSSRARTSTGIALPI